MKFFIVGKHQGYATPFLNYGMTQVNVVEDADVLVFCGGTDVHPKFYNVDPVFHEMSYDVKRDDAEAELYESYPDKWKVGICRGSQFLNVMNGGTLIQDMKGHASHRQHLTTFDNKYYHVTSTHHQGSLLGEGGTLLAESTKKLGSEYVLAPDIITNDEIEVEAYIYKDTKTIGMQFHPEFVAPDHECAILFKDILDKVMV